MTVAPGGIVTIDPLFDDAGAAAMVDLCTRFGRYRLYSEHEKIEVEIGRGLAQRHDAVLNFLRTRGASGASLEEVGARTSYFREEYGYSGQPLIDGAVGIPIPVDISVDAWANLDQTPGICICNGSRYRATGTSLAATTCAVVNGVIGHVQHRGTRLRCQGRRSS